MSDEKRITESSGVVPSKESDSWPEPPWKYIDPGIRPLVQLLHAHGFKMYSSCEGGDDHAFGLPTVVVWMLDHAARPKTVEAMIEAGCHDFSVAMITNHKDSVQHNDWDGPSRLVIELESLASIAALSTRQ